MQSKRKSKRPKAPRSPWGKHPPQLRTNVTINHRYRFTSTNAASTSILDSDLLGIAGAVCSVANSTLRMIAASTKLHSVEVWTPPASQGAAATCSLQWASTTFSPTVEVSDTSVSVAEPAHIVATPPPGSASSFWMGAAGNAVMTLVCPVGSIIDVTCTHLLMDTGAAGTAYTVAAGVLGALYFLPLDGDTDLYPPVSLTTTT